MRSFLLLTLALSTFPALAQLNYDEAAFDETVRSERHPIGDLDRSGDPPTRGYDMKYLRCTWDLDPAVRYISGSVTSYFTATADLDQLIFDLSDSLTVDDVTMHGNALAYSQDPGDLLVITLPASIPAGQTDSITVTYHGVPPNTGFGSFITDEHDGAPIVWTLSEPYGAKDWWPSKQDLNDKVDSLDTYVTTPMNNRAAGNGVLMAPDTTDDHVTWHWRHRHPIDYYLIATAVTNYQVDIQYVVLDGDSMPMVTYAYPEDFDAAVTNATGLLPKITLFSQLFGTYPFANEKYGHAQFGWGGGMEHQTMSFLGVYHPEISAHELAHQWFGDKVTCASWQDIWLNEGFATYLSGLAYEYLSPVYWPIWKRGKINSIISQPDGSVFCTDTLDQSRLFSGRLSYNKGAMVVHMLRWICGDSAFYQGVRNYLDDPMIAYGTATTPDLQAHLEATSGLDLTGFFADWFTGEGYPSYTNVWSQTGDGEAHVTLSQTTSHPSVGFFELPVPIRFYGGGTDSTVVLDNTVNDQQFSFHLPFSIDSAAFDPDIWLISGHNLTTSVSELDRDRPLLVLYPNPAEDILLWRIPGSGPRQLARVVDALGRTVFTGDAANGSIDIRRLSPGGYVLELSGGGVVLRSRFVKR